MSSHRNRVALAKSACAPILLLALLGGCSSDSVNNYSQLWDVAKTVWTQRDTKVTVTQAAAVPYATLGYRIGDGGQGMLVLATKEGSDELYVSHKTAIEVLNGRIIRTSGLEHNSNARGLQSTDAYFSTGPRVIRWTIDYPDEGIFSAEVECHDAPAGPEDIQLLGTTIHTIRIDEHCDSATLGWSFDNVFWIDPDSRRVWRSIQYTHPKADPLELEALRPSE